MNRNPHRLFESAPAWGLALLAVSFWPGFEEPGRAIRESLLPILALSALAWRLRPGTSPLPGSLVAAVLALTSMAGLALLSAPQPEWAITARDSAVAIAPWLFALAVAGTRFRPGPALGAAVLFVSPPILAEAWLSWSIFPSAAPPAGPFVNRNVAAGWLVPLVPLLLGEMLASERSRARRLYAGSAALAVAALIATRSRGGWVALFAALSLLLFLAVRHRKKVGAYLRRSRGALLSVAAVATIAFLIPVRSGDGLPSASRTLALVAQSSGGSVDVRKAIWANSLAMIGDEPWIGIGSGRFAVEYPLFHDARRPTPDFGLERQPRHAHNDFLETAVEWGLPAALLWLGLNAVVLLGWKSSHPDASAALTAAGRRAAIAGLLAHSLFSFPWHSPASAALAAALIGGLWPTSERGGYQGGGVVSARRRVIPALCVSAALVLCGLALTDLRGQAALARALDAVDRDACREAVEESKLVASYRRHDLGLAAMIRFHCDPSAETTRPVLESALARQPHQLNLLLATGPRQLKAGDPAAAERTFRHAVRIAPDQPRAWLGLAMTYERLGDLGSVRKACLQALELDPHWNPAVAYCFGNGFVSARGL